MAVGGPVGGGAVVLVVVSFEQQKLENNFSQKLIAFSNNRSHPSGMHVCVLQCNTLFALLVCLHVESHIL